MEREVYVVTQEGVYRHHIFGVFPNEQDAIAAAKRAAEEDDDHYHDYQVSLATLGQFTREDVNPIGRFTGDFVKSDVKRFPRICRGIKWQAYSYGVFRD